MSATRLLLCADDYAMTEGISRGIEQLATAGRLSMTSALVNSRHWPAHGRRLAGLRGSIAIGLHVNLTLGQPLGAMPGLAPDDVFPAIGVLTRRAVTGAFGSARLRAEIAGEIGRQIDRFTEATGWAPDFLDGHQHAHALPGIRHALIAALATRTGSPPPLVRTPADSPAAILRRGLEVTKSTVVAGLASGFSSLLATHALPTNSGFSGFSAFDRARPYADELARAVSHPGTLHLVMCHPGYPDAELAVLDPVVDRRADELAALLAEPDLDQRIWRPTRAVDGPPIDWRQV